MLEEGKLEGAERAYIGGITSAELLDLFAQWGVQMSEATLRKYVQLGLLPRSVRVGRKGKHRGSQGIYPVGVLRQILRIKAMMADNYTIEQIQKDFFFMRSDMHTLEQSMRNIFDTLASIVKERRRRGYAQDLSRDIEKAKHMGGQLMQQLESVEARLTTRVQLQRLTAS